MLLQTLCLTLSPGASVTFHWVRKLMYDHSDSLLVKLELMRNPWHSIWWTSTLRTHDNSHFVFGVNTITPNVADDIKLDDIAQWSVMRDPVTVEMRAHGDSGWVSIRTEAVSVSCTRWSTTQSEKQQLRDKDERLCVNVEKDTHESICSSITSIRRLRKRVGGHWLETKMWNTQCDVKPWLREADRWL